MSSLHPKMGSSSKPQDQETSAPSTEPSQALLPLPLSLLPASPPAPRQRLFPYCPLHSLQPKDSSLEMNSSNSHHVPFRMVTGLSFWCPAAATVARDLYEEATNPAGNSLWLEFFKPFSNHFSSWKKHCSMNIFAKSLNILQSFHF